MWNHDEYLNLLDVEPHVRAQIATSEEFLRQALPGVSLGQMFLGNGAPPGGPPFGGLWYFTDTYRIIVAQFLTEPMYQISRAGAIEGCGIEFHNWEPKRPEANSTMSVIFRDPFGGGAGAAARGINCTQLYDVSKEFILGKLRLA